MWWAGPGVHLMDPAVKGGEGGHIRGMRGRWSGEEGGMVAQHL